eukprot:SAG31_NODE_86_length_26973_cov_16.850897_5_plen_111_part_00
MYASVVPAVVFVASACVKTAISTAADTAGVGQAKVMADTGNLQSVLQVLMPLCYGAVWRRVSGQRKALLGAPFLVAALGSLVAELAALTLLTNANLNGCISQKKDVAVEK